MKRAVNIIVPIYRNAELVRACIESLQSNLPEISDRDPRLILINDSPDDTPVNELLGGLNGHGPGLQILVNEKNLGFIKAVNRGLDLSRKEGRDVLLVNSDTLTFPGTMAELLSAVAADPQIGFAAPRSNNASISTLPHFHGGRLPTPAEARERWQFLARTMPDWHFAPTAVGFYMFIAHTVLANHEGLREDFGVGYEEENDLVMRAGKVGQRAIVVNRAFAYHAGSASFALTDLSLHEHRHANFLKLTALHPEFTTLVHRYESSPHFRAERLMSGLLGDEAGRLRIVLDLTGLGLHHNGTNELAVAVVRSLANRWSDKLRVAGIGSVESFKFHGLDEVAGLHREEPGAAGLHGVALRFGQPFDMHHINVLEGLAPINVFAMLDTISEDCGPLAVESDFVELWDHVANHTNGLLFISQFSERQFCTRHPAARQLPRMARLLSTHLSEYSKSSAGEAGADAHVLILGNHFPHKGADVAASRLATAFPMLNFVVLGASTFQQGNLSGFRSGLVEATKMEQLFVDASAVVLPSHIEGFGFGFMHALAAGKPIVARRIPATEEILSVLDDVEGVFLYETDPELAAALQLAMGVRCSSARDGRGPAWQDWADGVAEHCLQLASGDDIFPRTVSRIAAGDLRRQALAGRSRNVLVASPVPSGPPSPSAASAQALTLENLLSLQGAEFVEHAYATLLARPADESGLSFYVAELESGLDKAEILRALSVSAEGRARAVKLEGLDELIAERSIAAAKPPRSLVRRLLGR